ncbi:MAG: hypothetical protein C4519_20115 [Desulfobacteraceae bacterium]|nr:MAG: hypothetical protein C4519_20115 [Desulfobacteraceae bacterium]
MNQSRRTEKPVLTDGPSEKGFYVGLYLEHMEESSFLYEQRLGLFEDPQITWTDIEDFEERLEAHIDALVVGEDLALDVCRMRAAEGDFGELHSAIRVFCRQKRLDYLQEALEEAELNDDSIRSITEALKHELPAEWQDLIRKMLLFDEVDLIKIAATVAAFKRLPFGDELLKIVQDKKNNPVPEVIHAIGRLGEKRAQDLLLTLLKDAEGKIAYEISLALLRMGHLNILGNLLKTAREKEWPFILIGIAGNKEHVPILHDLYYKRVKSPNLLLCLGFLGDMSSIPILVDSLLDEQSGNIAAISLNLITGADLYEEVFIPEEIDEDTLFEDEVEKVKKGEPLNENSEPHGARVIQLSRNPDAWQKWWQDNSKRFDPSLCYRNGKPFSKASIIENLLSENSPHVVRKLAHEEWVIKSGNNLPFETDLPVSMQRKLLMDIQNSKAGMEHKK